MSATIPPTTSAAIPAPSPPPLISSSPATQATAAASSLSAAALVVILIYVVQGLAHITIPGEVTAALTSLIGAGVHWVGLKYGLPTEP